MYSDIWSMVKDTSLTHTTTSPNVDQPTPQKVIILGLMISALHVGLKYL